MEENFEPNDNTCSICLEDIYCSKKDWCLLPCDHKFHPECIGKWWEKTKTRECAYCRESCISEHDNLAQSIDKYITKMSYSGMIPSSDRALKLWIYIWMEKGKLPIPSQLPRREADFNYRYLVSFIRTKPQKQTVYKLFLERISVLIDKGYIEKRGNKYRWK